MSKNPFIEFVKIWRKENPNVSYKDALKSAAVDYKKIGKPKSSEPKPKKPKSTEEKEVKNGRAKLIRAFKKLETSVNSGISSGNLDMEKYDEFRKIGNVLRGNSLKNSYAKKLKDIDRKLKTKKFLSLQAKLGKSEANIQMKISQNKKLTKDLENEATNKDKASAKIRKAERIAKRKRALQQLKNNDGTRKYSDTQIDQMLKLEESGLSSKEAKSQTSALGKYLVEDYLKEFMRINPLFTKANAEAYLKRNDSYRKDPYNVPIITDPEELRNADKKPKPPPLPPAPKPTAPAKVFKLSKANQKLRDDLFKDFGINNSVYKIDDLTEDLAKDLYFGEKNGMIDDREKLTASGKIQQKLKKVQRVMKAYGTERNATYSRLQEIESLLDDYDNGLVGFKGTIRADAKKEKEQVSELLELISDTGAPITAKTKATADDISAKEAQDFINYIEGTSANVKTEVDKSADDKKVGEAVKKSMEQKAIENKKEAERLALIAEQANKRLEEKAKKEAIEKDKALSNTARAKQLKAQAKKVEKQKKKEATELAKIVKQKEKAIAQQKKFETEQAKIAKAIKQATKKSEPKKLDEVAPIPNPPPTPPKPADAGGAKAPTPPTPTTPKSGGAKKIAIKKAISQKEIDSVRKEGAMVRTYTRRWGNKRANETLDIVEDLELAEGRVGARKTEIDKENPISPNYTPPAPTPTPVIAVSRGREQLEDEITTMEQLIKEAKDKVDYNGVYKKVDNDLRQALVSGNVGHIDAEVASVFDDFLSKGANLDGATAKALSEGLVSNDFNDFDFLIQQDPIAQNTIDSITREILMNVNPTEYTELDSLEDTLGLLETEYEDYESDSGSETEGEGFAKVKHHLRKAQQYWSSGRMNEHANLVRKHLKKAKIFVDILPKNEMSDKIKKVIDTASMAIDPVAKVSMNSYVENKGGALTNISQPYDDANTGGSLVRDIKKHLNEINENKNDMDKRNEIMKKLHSLLEKLDDKNLQKKLNGVLNDI